MPAPQPHSTLGLPYSFVGRNTVADSGDALRYTCTAQAWSGATPASLQAAFRKGRSGHGALFGIETWQPNDGSPDAYKWPDGLDDYDRLTVGFPIGSVAFPGLLTKAGWQTKRVQLPRLGYDASGIVASMQGPTKGMLTAIGCWWNNGSRTAACLAVEEAASRPVVEHLNQLAKIAVPKVLG